MFASLVSLLPLIAGLFVTQSKPFRVAEDLEALLARIRQRRYPETLPVLVYYWLKTVKASGYGRRQWKKLSSLLKRVLNEQLPDTPSHQAIVSVQTRIQTVLLAGQPPRHQPPQSERIFATLSSDLLAPYIRRLLNEWLPAEAARLLVNGSASSLAADGEVPLLGIGRALEGLLVRERLSPRALEMLLQPEPYSPHYVYSADTEILQDVILFLLGRKWASPWSVMPGELLCVAPDSLLPANYREAVNHAFLVPRLGGEEVHVPIPPAQALKILKDEQLRIGSMMVTMDGRWWEAVGLQDREPHSVVYRPVGRPRLEYLTNHVKLRVPCSETWLSGHGDISFPPTFKIFGREWRLSHWEQDAERIWLHLVLSHVLTDTVPAGDARWWRLRPVSADLVWSGLENALASSIVQGSSEPIERFRHSDLIPLGCAIFELATSLIRRRLPPCEVIETKLRGIRCLEAQVSSKYGRVPWRILPEKVHASLFKIRSHPELVELLNQVFDSLPQRLSDATRPDPRPTKARAVGVTILDLTATCARDQQFPNFSDVA
jgi:hypothetical protein